MKRALTRHWALITYVVATQAWLLSPALNHHISFSKAYVSDLFLPTQPWAWLFRIIEVLSGLALTTASFQVIYKKAGDFNRSAGLWLIRVLGILTIIDGIFIDSCPSDKLACSLHGPVLAISIAHGIESILSVVILLLLACLVIRDLPRRRLLTYGLLACLVVILSLQLAGSYSILGKGLWQRAFITLSNVPVGIALLV